MDGIRSWIEAAGSGHWFFVAFPVCLLILFIWFKGRRVRFLIPSLIMSTVIINPWFYRAWDKLGLYAYWRILWVVPVVPIVAGLVPSITERIQKGWIKSIVVAAGVGAVMVGGTFLYNGAGGSFAEATNAAKLPNGIIEIADKLLELNNHPRVIAEPGVSVYIRQYTGKIDTLFGRNIYGYILEPGTEVRDIFDNISNREWSAVNRLMLDEGYDYFVYSGDVDRSFELVDRVNDYGIYKAVGTPNIKKVRNEKGQVIEETTLDARGNPENCSLGYATIHREYDSYNNVVLEYRDDESGEPVLYPGGNQQVVQTWEGYNKLLSRCYFDEDGNLLNRSDGYAKVKWIKDSNGTENVHFYNVDDNEISIQGLNLVKDVEVGTDGWSEWITPEPNTVNNCVTVGYANLGEKTEGDLYSCHIEIEYKGVTATEGQELHLWTQGSADNDWDIGNVWNFVVYIDSAPEDGIYQYSAVKSINEKMENASEFELGFRCDNWATGSFRVRNVKIEKGDKFSEWSPGL